MELTHEFTVPAPVEETWDAFNDIESVAACFPGATVTAVEGDTFTRHPARSSWVRSRSSTTASGTFVEKDETAHRIVIDAKGKDKRGNGTAGRHVTATMDGRPATRPTSRCSPTSRSPASRRSSAAG